jgi:hypothetical protein
MLLDPLLLNPPCPLYTKNVTRRQDAEDEDITTKVAEAPRNTQRCGVLPAFLPTLLSSVFRRFLWLFDILREVQMGPRLSSFYTLEL